MKYLLLFEHFLFEATTPAQAKAKMGIGKDVISDEDFETLMGTGMERNLLVDFSRFRKDTSMETLLYYVNLYKENGVKTPLRGKSFIEFTEDVDAHIANKNTKQAIDGFDVRHTEPDYMSRDGRYRVYDAKDRTDCIRFGKGFAFCISRASSGNMYYSYRGGQESKFYFVYDTKLSPDDNTYITVVDAQPDGKFEFTHQENRTEENTALYKGKLTNFIKSKPGLQELASVFIPVPLTEEERADRKRWALVDRDNLFKTLTYPEKKRFIGTGEYPIYPADFDALPTDLKSDYLNMLLFISPESLQKLPLNLQRTWVRQSIINDRKVAYNQFMSLPVDLQVDLMTNGLCRVDKQTLKGQDPRVIDAYLAHIEEKGSDSDFNKDQFNRFSDEQKIRLLKKFNFRLTEKQFLKASDEVRDYAIASNNVVKVTDETFTMFTPEWKLKLLEHDLVLRISLPNFLTLDIPTRDKYYRTSAVLAHHIGFRSQFDTLSEEDKMWALDKELMDLESYQFFEQSDAIRRKMLEVRAVRFGIDFQRLPPDMKKIASENRLMAQISMHDFIKIDRATQAFYVNAKLLGTIYPNEIKDIPAEWLERFCADKLIQPVHKWALDKLPPEVVEMMAKYNLVK